MKQYKFIVVFTNHNYKEVMAFNKQEAIILSQAEMIKEGLSYNVDHVKWFKSDNNYVLYKGN